MIKYSALKSRLLLPPNTKLVLGSRGPIERMSKPRMLYSPPRNSRSKIGSTCVLTVRPDVIEPARGNRTDVRMVWRKNPDCLGPRLDELGVAAETGEVARKRQPPTGDREDRIVDGVEDEARHDLADRALAPLTNQQ